MLFSFIRKFPSNVLNSVHWLLQFWGLYHSNNFSSTVSSALFSGLCPRISPSYMFPPDVFKVIFWKIHLMVYSRILYGVFENPNRKYCNTFRWHKLCLSQLVSEILSHKFCYILCLITLFWHPVLIYCIQFWYPILLRQGLNLLR